MKDITKKYSNGEVTVVWKPNTCMHSTICWKGMLSVFNPTVKPWINMDGGTTQAIIEQVKKCPSGALTYYMNLDEQQEPVHVDVETIIEASKNGPLLVYGNITIKDAEGHETKKNKVTALCRCGQSSNKPYCDGTHKKVGFEG